MSLRLGLILLSISIFVLSAPVHSSQVADGGTAEMPMLDPVPFVFSKTDYGSWVAERGALYRRLSFLQRKGIDIIRDCRGVEGGSELKDQCGARREALSDERKVHINTSNAFNQRLGVAVKVWLENAEPREVRGFPLVVRHRSGTVSLWNGDVEIGEEGAISASRIKTGVDGQISILLANGYLIELGADSEVGLDLSSVEDRPKQLRLHLGSFEGILVLRPEDDWLSSTAEIAVLGPFGCLCTKGGSLQLSTNSAHETTVNVVSGRVEIMRHTDGQIIRLKSPGTHKFSP